jgi:hypothetical protein
MFVREKSKSRINIQRELETANRRFRTATLVFFPRGGRDSDCSALLDRTHTVIQTDPEQSPPQASLLDPAQ